MKRRTFTALACVLALGMGATSAQALAIDDANYLGNIVPGLPSGETNEAAFIDALIALAPGADQTPCGDDAATPNTCTRSDNVFANLPSPADFTDKDESGDNTVDVTGFAYILAKYGKGSETQISHVWYVGNLTGEQTVPDSSGGGLSHISRFNATTNGVPDGGTTLMLLGTALVGLGALRRRFNV